VDSAEFAARQDAFPGLRSFLEEACHRAGVARPDCLRLVLIVEELFVNTVVHGHGGDSDAPVRLEVTVTPTAIAVCYEDTAPAFDPCAVSEPSEPGEPKVGGLGVHLVRSMAQDLAYRRTDGCNQITFRIARPA
jgi:serine/threonine-protein kinase RsbW